MRMRPAETPRAPRHPTVLREHDDERVDEWFWLRERDDPAVLAYLEAENAFTEHGLASTEALREQILRGDLSPGVRLVEATLADGKRLGGPVRRPALGQSRTETV